MYKYRSDSFSDRGSGRGGEDLVAGVPYGGFALRDIVAVEADGYATV